MVLVVSIRLYTFHPGELLAISQNNIKEHTVLPPPPHRDSVLSRSQPHAMAAGGAENAVLERHVELGGSNRPRFGDFGGCEHQRIEEIPLPISPMR